MEKLHYNNIIQAASWSQYAAKVDDRLRDTLPSPENYDLFVNVIWRASRQCIPRGCSTAYNPDLTYSASSLMNKYASLFSEDPFSEIQFLLVNAT